MPRNNGNVPKTLIPLETPKKPLSLATRVLPAITFKSPMLMTVWESRGSLSWGGGGGYKYVFRKRTKKSTIWSLNAWLSKRPSRKKCWSLLIPDIKSHLSRDGWQLCSLKMLFYYNAIIITNRALWLALVESITIVIMKPQYNWLPMTLTWDGALQRGVGDGGGGGEGWGHQQGSNQMAQQTQRKEPCKEGFFLLSTALTCCLIADNHLARLF